MKVTFALFKGKQFAGFSSRCRGCSVVLNSSAMLVLYVCMMVSAAARTHDGFDYIILSNGKVEIIGYVKNDPEIVIPEMIDEIPVVSIYKISSSYATKIIISNSIEVIEDSAFVQCTAVKSFEVIEPNGHFTAIGGVLYDETVSKLVALPPKLEVGVFQCPSSLKTIANASMINNSYIEVLMINSGMGDIGLENLENWPKLREINVDGSNVVFKSINGVLFGYDYEGDLSLLLRYPSAKLGLTYKFPSEVSTIGHAAFNGCMYLTKLDLPAGMSSIWPYSFANCPNLGAINISSSNSYYTSVEGVLYSKDMVSLIAYPSGKINNQFEIPNTVKIIEPGAFHSATYLRNLLLNEGLEIIYRDAFYNCYNLGQIKLPASLESLENAFEKCTSLVRLTIPSGKVDYFIYNLRSDFENLTYIDVSGEDEHYSCVDGVIYTKDLSRLYYCPIGRAGHFEIPPGTLYADFSNARLVSVFAPSSLHSIILNGCIALEAIVVDSENSFFESLDGVLYDEKLQTLLTYPASRVGTAFSIPSTVEKIDYEAFRGARFLTKLTISTSVQYCPIQTFGGNLSEAYFLGSAPDTLGWACMQGTADEFTIYIRRGADGFSDWNRQYGYVIKEFGESILSEHFNVLTSTSVANWYTVPWFGWLFDKGNSWAYHLNHHYQFYKGNDTVDGLYIWD